VLLLLATGCGAAVRSAATEAPHAAVPVVIDETLKAGEDAHTRERIVAVLATPEMKQAIAEVARAAVTAALEEVTSPDSKQRIAELTKTFAGALAESMEREIVPAVLAGTRASLKSTFSAADQRALDRVLASTTAAATTAALGAAAKEIPTTVGPAVRESLARELQAPDLDQAVAGLVSHAARDVLLSTRQTVADVREQNAAEGKLGPIDKALRTLSISSWILAIIVGVVGVGLAVWIVRMRRRTRRYRTALLELMAKNEDGERNASERDPARMQHLLEMLQ
jgi:hypothetical protein